MFHLNTNVSNGEVDYWFQLESCDYEQRCGSSKLDYSHPWITPPSTAGSGNYMYETYKFYSGTKQLRSYDFKVRTRCASYQPPILYPGGTYDIYFTEWVHIQD